MFDIKNNISINAPFKHLTSATVYTLYIQSMFDCSVYIICNKKTNTFCLPFKPPPPFFLKRKHPPRFFLQPIMAWFFKKICQHFSTCPNMMLNLLSAFHSIPLLDITIGIRLRHIIENLEYLVIISNRLLKKDEKNNFYNNNKVYQQYI